MLVVRGGDFPKLDFPRSGDGARRVRAHRAHRRRGGADVAQRGFNRVREPGDAAVLGVQLCDLVLRRGFLRGVRRRCARRLYVSDKAAESSAEPALVGELGADRRDGVLLRVLGGVRVFGVQRWIQR